ncbi:MAG: kinase [Myxococcota bacterium]
MLWPRSSIRSLHADLPDVRPVVRAWAEELGIATPSDAMVADYYFPMASWLADHVADRTVVAGIAGAQGTGKSSLASVLKRLLEAQFGVRTAILSLDDLYLSREARAERAETYHPLLVTRGVPGTHDVSLGLDVLSALRRGESVALPRFDKATDQPLPKFQWPIWNDRCDLVLFEGWCVGARPQRADELSEPVNGLERLEDSTGGWRWYVNRQLGGAYQQLFSELDLLVLLRPPDFEHVLAWREEQETKLRERMNASEAMSPTAVRRFVLHFERLTRFMWEEMPDRADAVIDLAPDHQVTDVTLGDG